MSSRVELTRLDLEHGFEDALRRDPAYDKWRARETAKVAKAVREVAPDETGYYRRRVRASAAGRVVASDPFWHLIEFGSINNRAVAPLRLGAIAAGTRFVPSRI